MEKRNQETLKRWQHNRFGMFIHWGIYALAARHEWVKSKEQMTTEEYQKYFDYFCPDKYDPEEWADYAKRAGMKYIVLTTKHHDGFCLWDSKLTDYKVTNTPYGKDLLRPFVEAFRNAGLRIGLYHSLIDWHHPQYVVAEEGDNHPMRDNAEYKAQNENRDMSKYAEYLHGQIREILTEFGEIDQLFLDFSWKDKNGNVVKGRNDWQSEKLVKLIRELQPGILINDRLDLNEFEWAWDFRTPEQILVRECPTFNGKPVPWETCQTFSGSWGYYRDEYTWKNVEQLVKLLIDTVSKGGNLLLNVGPTARGEFDERAKQRLIGMGKWMERHSRSIYGCTQAPKEFLIPQDCRLTYNPDVNRLYVHVFSWPIDGRLYLDGFAGKVKYAQLLNDFSEVRYTEIPGGHLSGWLTETEDKKTLILEVPVKQPSIVPVIELFLD